MNPRPVDETAMLWVAAAAVILNGGIMLGLHRDASHRSRRVVTACCWECETGDRS